MNDVSRIHGTAAHLEHGDAIEVKFQPGWASGWRFIGVHPDTNLVSVERESDGATLVKIDAKLVRKARGAA